MRRRLIGLLAVALLAAACTAGGGGGDKPAATIDPNAQHDPMTLTVWSNFSAREYDVTTAVLQSIKQKYPWMTIKHVGGKDDAAILRAINGGTPPDMAISFTPSNSARYCKTGAMQDLNPYLTNDKVDNAPMLFVFALDGKAQLPPPPPPAAEPATTPDNPAAAEQRN